MRLRGYQVTIYSYLSSIKKVDNSDESTLSAVQHSPQQQLINVLFQTFSSIRGWGLIGWQTSCTYSWETGSSPLSQPCCPIAFQRHGFQLLWFFVFEARPKSKWLHSILTRLGCITIFSIPQPHLAMQSKANMTNTASISISSRISNAKNPAFESDSCNKHIRPVMKTTPNIPTYCVQYVMRNWCSCFGLTRTRRMCILLMKAIDRMTAENPPMC